MSLFRIYQSWVHSFALRYWTDLQIPTESICDPGQNVKTLSPSQQMSMRMFGITVEGNKPEIEAARDRFGGLQNIDSESITSLFEAISHGFLLDAQVFAPTNTVRFVVQYHTFVFMRQRSAI